MSTNTTESKMLHFTFTILFETILCKYSIIIMVMFWWEILSNVITFKRFLDFECRITWCILHSVYFYPMCSILYKTVTPQIRACVIETFYWETSTVWVDTIWSVPNFCPGLLISELQSTPPDDLADDLWPEGRKWAFPKRQDTQGGKSFLSLRKRQGRIWLLLLAVAWLWM